MSTEKKNLNIEDLENVAGGVDAYAKNGVQEHVITSKVNTVGNQFAAVNGLFKDNVFSATLAEANAVASKLGHKPFATIQEAKAWAQATKSPMASARHNKII